MLCKESSLNKAQSRTIKLVRRSLDGNVGASAMWISIGFISTRIYVVVTASVYHPSHSFISSLSTFLEQLVYASVVAIRFRSYPASRHLKSMFGTKRKKYPGDEKDCGWRMQAWSALIGHIPVHFVQGRTWYNKGKLRILQG